jgi:hypothetical protein
MRAATAIVGAIAAASILIALALILSGGSSHETVTRTVTEAVAAAPKPDREEAAGTAEEADKETGGARSGGPTECEGGNLTVENVSCEVGAEIRGGYEEGGRSEILAQDKKAGETITMSCSGAAPTECKGPGGAKVYFAE